MLTLYRALQYNVVRRCCGSILRCHRVSADQWHCLLRLNVIHLVWRRWHRRAQKWRFVVAVTCTVRCTHDTSTVQERFCSPWCWNCLGGRHFATSNPVHVINLYIYKNRALCSWQHQPKSTRWSPTPSGRWRLDSVGRKIWYSGGLVSHVEMSSRTAYVPCHVEAPCWISYVALATLARRHHESESERGGWGGLVVGMGEVFHRF